jgi:small subunit ribosomal protein S6
MARYYDLFVLLDPEAPEERRTALVEQVKRQIDSGGSTLKGDADWGMRRLSYEIDHRREAQYHLFQFEGTPEVLGQLDRSLSIDDSVLRHRIIRLPALPETTPSAPEEAPRRTEERGAPRDGARREAAEDQAAEAVPADAAHGRRRGGGRRAGAGAGPARLTRLSRHSRGVSKMSSAFAERNPCQGAGSGRDRAYTVNSTFRREQSWQPRTSIESLSPGT